ncbi:MAG: hypothetical protein AAF635_06285 [Cyanobacteria bacterium P01_C01_bin.69]
MANLETTISMDAELSTSKARDAGCIFWDFSGVDGLQAAIALFTPAISHIAPFQSLTTTFSTQPCSVLRLCENNFRVAFCKQVAFEAAIAALNLKVWSKPYSAATLVVPTNFGLERLPKIGKTKPVYTLEPFPCDRAVPARIDGVAILAWHHLWGGQPTLHIQTSATNAEIVIQAFS